ncbi:MAG: MFS transporter [Acidobacteria bacterium]|nr:MAG: MFS transporter [Acidobacteriota bacterium]
MPPTDRPHRASLAVVYLVVFLDLLGFGIILPSLPYFARQLGASGLLLGILFTSYSLAQLIGAAFLGRLSDRFGRRPVLLLSLLGATLAMVASGLAHALPALVLARALAGLFGGSIATAQAYVADVTSPEERARYMGLLGASIGSGFVFGPVLGAGVLALGWGFPGSAFVAAGLSAGNLAFAAVKLRESHPGDAAPQRREGWLAALRRPHLGPVLAAIFLVTFSFVGMETTFAFFSADRFGLSERDFALVLTYAGLVMIAVQGGLVGRLTRRFGVRPVAVCGGLLMAAALAALPFGPTLAATLAVLGALAAGQGLAVPSLTTLVSQLSDRDEQGTVLGVSQSLASAARASGPLAAGALYDLHLAAPYLLGGVLALLAAGLILTARVAPAG